MIYMIYVDVRDWEDDQRYERYSYFYIYSEAYNFKLYLSGSSGSAEDSLGSVSGDSFSTFDRENDVDRD